MVTGLTLVISVDDDPLTFNFFVSCLVTLDALFDQFVALLVICDSLFLSLDSVLHYVRFSGVSVVYKAWVLFRTKVAAVKNRSDYAWGDALNVEKPGLRLLQGRHETV